MSKSKKNVIDPDDILATYGADTARFFVLSDSPPDRDVVWTESGVQGTFRFVQRIWRLISEAAPALSTATAQPGKDGKALEVSRAAHKTLKAVAADIEALAFNKAIARIYELVNVLAAPLTEAAEGKADAQMLGALKQASLFLTHCFAPMMPHLAEECWKALGETGMIATAAWPAYDASLTADNEITLPVQVNGKKRAELTVARDADQDSIKAAVMALEAVVRALDGKTPKKVIVVPQRIVNIVV